MRFSTFSYFRYLRAIPSFSQSDTIDPSDWDSVLSQASGQTVYWNAWGGSDTYNEYMAWSHRRLSVYTMLMSAM